MSETRCEINIVRDAGGINAAATETRGGIFVWFTDPQTGTTLGMFAHDIHEIGDIKRHMDASREIFRRKRLGQEVLDFTGDVSNA